MFLDARLDKKVAWAARIQGLGARLRKRCHLSSFSSRVICNIGQSIDTKSVDAVLMDEKYVDLDSGVVRQYIDDTIATVTH